MASWATTKYPVARGARWYRSTLLTGAVIVAAVSFTGNAAEAATAPSPEPGQVVTATSSANQQNKLFYQRRDHSLVVVSGTGSTWGAPAGLGGKLTSGPGAIVIGSEFAVTSVFVRGGNSAIWYRQYSDGRGVWTPWATLGGRTTGAPAASCVEPGTTTALAVWIRGLDGALWWRRHAQDVSGATWSAWSRVGGRLLSDPTGTVVAAGGCSVGPGVFALGTDAAVWQWNASTWRRVGGRSTVAPAAVVLASGETDVFVRGTDNALWRASRARGSTHCSWQRIGGALTSAPTVALFPSGPETTDVYAMGADSNVWEIRHVTGTSTWTWRQVP